MNPWRGLRALPREVWILAFVTFINRTGMMALPFLVLYLTQNLGYAATTAGFVITLYGLGAMVAAPFSGKLSDRIGPFRLMTISLLLSGVILLLFPLATQLPAILCLTLLWAMIGEAFRPASLAAITGIVAPDQRKAAYALNRLAINLGMSIGPAAGGFLLLISYPLIFWVDGATALLAGTILAFARVQDKSSAAATPLSVSEVPAAPTPRRVALTDTRLLFFLLAIVPVVIVFFQHESTLPLFLVGDLLLPESAFGILFTLNTLLIVLIEVPLNLAMAHWSHRRTLTLGALLLGIGFGATALATGLLSAAISVSIWTFGEMVFLPGAVAYMGEIAPAERRGEYMGLYQMTFSLGFTLSGVIGTALFERFGSTVLWSVMLVAGIVSAIALWRVDRKIS
ncbi:MAG: Multidrug resistance protein MdtH [bacterium]|nr:Multidrug resistance protein MdtH [bacterium]